MTVMCAAVNLSTSTTMVGDDVVVAVSGEVDLATIPQLHDVLTKALTQHSGRTLVVDLDGVTLLDDTGLGVLLGAAGSARQAGGDLVIVCNHRRLRERFDATGFSRAIEVRERLGGART
jgi:anti-sigma B factor antagonist